MQRYAITSLGIPVPSAGDRASSDSRRGQDLPRHCGALARLGVEFILLREKHLPAGQLAALTRAVLAEVRAASPEDPAQRKSTRVLVAGRPDIALATGADGVHLSAATGELRPDQVQRLFHGAARPHAIVSVSCHTLEEVRVARDGGASMVLFAPVFAKVVDGVEVAPGVGLERLREACIAAREMPVFALGGVNPDNAGACIGAGATGVAGIRMFF